jgi:type IV pilus assembly protein PilE
LRGWTLIELLLVLGLMGWLAQWALPLSAELMLRTQRSEARLALLQTAHWLERAAATQGRYPETLPDSAWALATSSYRLSYTATAQGQRYTLLAIPLGAQSQDPCGTLSLDQSGARGVRSAVRPAQTCWSR